MGKVVEMQEKPLKVVQIIEESLIDPDELAERLKVPKSWVYERTRRKGKDTIPMIKVGKYLRFRFSEVMAWLES